MALGGDPDRQSLAALKQLARLAAARGAQVGVDLTWAWLDGKNPAFPSFRDMQVQLFKQHASCSVRVQYEQSCAAQAGIRRKHPAYDSVQRALVWSNLGCCGEAVSVQQQPGTIKRERKLVSLMSAGEGQCRVRSKPERDGRRRHSCIPGSLGVGLAGGR